MDIEKVRVYLDRDPDNLQLLASAAQASYDAKDLQQCEDYIAHYETLSELPAPLLYLRGIVALERHQADLALPILERAFAMTDDPSLRFALAWANALRGDFQRVVELLSDAAIASSPRAPALKVQALHHLGQLADALEQGKALFKRFPQDQRLAAALAVVALDADQPDLAAEYAKAGGAEPDALAARATLALDAGEVAEASPLWEEALAVRPDDPRALVGKGLSLMLANNPGAAAPYLDRGATAFGGHIGSWVAAGWAYFAQGDYAAARARFNKALALDDNFADSHGSLAVLDLLEGDTSSAQRRLAIARRLDGRSPSAAFAASLVANAQGNRETAAAILQKALSAPIDAEGRTLGQAIAKVGAGLKR